MIAPAALLRPERAWHVALDRWNPESLGDKEPRYRPDIDGLRSIAVGLVVLGHTGLSFSGGFIGVDVFFVISGFLITRLILSGYGARTLTLKQFWMRRVRRILPAAAVAVAATLLAGMILLRPTELAALGESAIAQQLCLANIYFWAQGGYFDLPSEYKPLLHTWSLAVEEQFYLIWPLVLLLVCRRGKKTIALTLAALGAVSLVMSEIMTRTHPSAAFYFMPPRIWELVLGAAVLYCPQWTVRQSSLFGVAGLVLILASALTYTPKTPFPGLSALVPCMGTALIILAPAAGRFSVTRLLSTTPAVYVGKASYSIYLWHWPLLVFTKMFFGKDFSLAAQVSVVLASLAIGSLSYAFVETPIRSRRWLANDRHLLSCCALGVMVICSAAYSMYSYLASKYPDVALGPPPAEFSGSDDSLSKYGKFGVYSWTLGGPKSGSRPPTFVVWGDSQARRLVVLCDALARSRGLSGRCLAWPGIMPLVGAWNNGLTESNFEPIDSNIALQWNRDVVDWIVHNKVRDVIIAARWDLLTGDGQPSTISPADARRVLEERFRQTVSVLESSGARVWFLMQVPVQEDDPLDRGSSRGVTKEAYEAQQHELTRFLNFWSSPALTVIGPGKNWFDRDGYSVKGDHGGSFYTDGNHVTRYGAQKLIGPLLEPVFDQIKEDLRAQKRRAF
jgi:peptidoglycan/LPS O-acetylase OafA/YrhL